MKPRLCYCRIRDKRLKEIVYKRFVDQIPTEDLMDQLHDVKDREYLAAIALLDVKVEDLPKVVPDNPGLLMHLYGGRLHIKSLLGKEGIVIKEGREVN